MTIKKETGSWKWSALGAVLPTVCGIAICLITTGVWNVVNYII